LTALLNYYLLQRSELSDWLVTWSFNRWKLMTMTVLLWTEWLTRTH